jgi:AmiR/NasT family two-component response regulator
MIWVPTVFSHGNVRVVVFTRNEHEPPHVHVEHPDGVVVVLLDEKTHQAVLREAGRKVKPGAVRAIVQLVDEHFSECLAQWERYHR